MSDFSEFLYRRRKAMGLTQQNIADALRVTNKAVSKWEAGECFPETAQLVSLADLLCCTVDELLRGRIKTEDAPREEAYTPFDEAEEEEDAEEEEEQKPRPRRPFKTWQGICFGVGAPLVLLGVVAFVLVFSFAGYEEKVNARIGAATLLCFVDMALFLFVYAGTSYGVTDVAEEGQEGQAKLCSAVLSTGVFIVVAACIVAVLSPNVIGIAVMLSVMAVGAAAIVFAGVGISRVEFKEEREREKDSPWSSVIMLTATGIYILSGFLFEKWSSAWIVFPIGAVLCGIVEGIEKFFGRKK